MRESRLYLNFFKKNLLIFVLFGLTGLGAGFTYQTKQPPGVEFTSLWQMEYDQTNVADRIALTDQAVTLVRSAHLRGEIASPGAKVTVYKPGPLAIELKAIGQTEVIARESNYQLAGYLKDHFPIKKIGQEVVTYQQPPLILGVILGLAVGLGVGLLVSLIKAYFEKF